MSDKPHLTLIVQFADSAYVVPYLNVQPAFSDLALTRVQSLPELEIVPSPI